MKTSLKITKKELIDLCLNSDYYFNTKTCYPEYVSNDVHNEIDYLLNTTKVTSTGLYKCFETIEDLKIIWGFETLEDVKKEYDLINDCDAVEMYKTLLVQEILDIYFMAVLYKKMVNNIGDCYVPETLSLSPTVEWLATDENVKIFEAKKHEKIKHDNRPLFTKEMMLNYIDSNKEMVKNSLIQLGELKKAENKPEWQVKANALVQKVSNNDFRVLNWKEIYNLIKENA